ncbi:MAG: polysaccharide biosynthesis/export family protein [Alphaproteobacteria bacterium]
MTSDVVDGTASGGINYIVVPVTQPVSQVLAFRPPTSFVKIFGEGTPPSSAVDIGDVLTVTIWEAGGGGLFTTATMPGQIIPTTRGATIAELVIARDGKISIPFLGRIAVAGMEPAEIEEKIVAGLAGKTVDPQALVVVTRNISNSVTVGGEIASGARIPLSVKGDKILDAIAAVGGIRILTVDATIQLTRGERTVDVPYNVLLDNPHENIYLLGGDILTVIREPRSFTAFGALTSNAQIQFQTKSMTLDEAMAKAGGLNDFRADPAGVFVFRYEPPSLARQISSDNGPYSDATLVPIVYWLDFHDAGAYFLARQFLIQDKDIIYVANARMTELQKFFTAIGAALTPATTSVALGAALTRP